MPHFSVTLDQSLIDFCDAEAKRLHTSRSGAIAAIIREGRDNRLGDRLARLEKQAEELERRVIMLESAEQPLVTPTNYWTGKV